MQERIERHPLGRIAISVFLIFTLFAILISNLPDSKLRSTVRPVTRPYVEATGLSQRWNPFAPNPRRSTLGLEARVLFRDGKRAVWRPPHGNALIGAYTAARWRKWATAVLENENLWTQTAYWVARQFKRQGKDPQIVQLVKRAYRAYPPGSGKRGKPPWREEVLISTLVPQDLDT